MHNDSVTIVLHQFSFILRKVAIAIVKNLFLLLLSGVPRTTVKDHSLVEAVKFLVLGDFLVEVEVVQTLFSV